MCGIAGAFGAPAALRADEQVRGVLAHRGPDNFGAWRDELVSLLHWRLAIIDLSPAGNQPMASADGRFVICYNGEVYNFEQLRLEIEEEWRRRVPSHAASARGERPWRGRSDTEVILEGFALWGVPFLARLNGIFALAIYDRQSRTIHLARDRAGIKPLYVWQRDGLLVFASEAKLFFHLPDFPGDVDRRGVSAFFTYGHGYEGHHVLAGVRQLEPGEVLTCRFDDSRVHATPGRLAPRPALRPVQRSDRDAAAELRRLLTGVVARQLVADVPVGVLLSGGVDSSILTALTARAMGAEKTLAFTLGYRGVGPDYDEIDHARAVAKHLGVEHHVYEASQRDLVHDLEQMVWHYDEPFADAAALNMFVLSRLIRSHVTVALAGEGSDELFGGYRRYQLEAALRRFEPFVRPLSRIARALGVSRVGWVPRRLQVLLRALSRDGAAARYSSFLESEVPIEEILRPEWSTAIPVQSSIEEGYPDEVERDSTIGRLCVVDQRFWLPSTYLEKSDKGGMAHSLEVRVPFLDNEIVEFANSLRDDQRIRGGQRKWLLREAFGDIVPAEVFQRFKRGFGVPVSHWLRGELREYYVEHVLAPDARVHQYVRVNRIAELFRAHASGAHDYAGVLWQCLVLEIWLRHSERRFEQAPAKGWRARVG